MGDFCTDIMSDTSRLERTFIFVEVFGSAYFFCGGGGSSPQTLARQMLHPEERRSSAGDAFFVCSCCLNVEPQGLRL